MRKLLSVVLAYLGSYLLWVPVCAQVTAPPDHGSEQLKSWLSVGSALGAAIVFLVGLFQYQRGQQWKRAEFLASEIKALFESPKVSTALTMIDWSVRRIKLRALDGQAEEESTVVTLPMQCDALLPHDVLEPRLVPTEDGEVSRDGELRYFSTDEVIIRDCYDALLDGFDRLGAYLEAGLITVKQLRPHLRYWVEDITAPPSDALEALWCVSFFTYTLFYKFDGARVLFTKLGYNLDPDDEIFDRCMRKVAETHRLRATILQAAARKAWNRATVGSSPLYPPSP
jgi:hypothetical protein